MSGLPSSKTLLAVSGRAVANITLTVTMRGPSPQNLCERIGDFVLTKIHYESRNGSGSEARLSHDSVPRSTPTIRISPGLPTRRGLATLENLPEIDWVGIEPTHKGFACPEELAANHFAFRRSTHVCFASVRLSAISRCRKPRITRILELSLSPSTWAGEESKLLWPAAQVKDYSPGARSGHGERVCPGVQITVRFRIFPGQ
jgi:hypothetical protein